MARWRCRALAISSASLAALAWDPVPGASYQVFRRSENGVYSDPTAVVAAGTASYVDSTVSIGNTYGYVVRAVVGGSSSIPSNEVVQTTSPQLVQVTWRVRVPANTPPGDTVYMPGGVPELGPWDPGKVAMTQVEPGIWEMTLPMLEGTFVPYKYTRGSWEKVEHWGEIVGFTNRTMTVTYGTTGTQLVDDTHLIRARRMSMSRSAPGSTSGSQHDHGRTQHHKAAFSSAMLCPPGCAGIALRPHRPARWNLRCAQIPDRARLDVADRLLMAKVGDDDGVLVLASSRSLTPIWTVFNCQSIGGYINFMAGDDQDRIDANYRGNYQRLVEVKRKYNPGNLFHLNQNIRP